MGTFKQNMREIFSEGSTGKLSSKRILGAIAMFVALGCTVYLVIRDGSNDVVEDLLMTVFIMSASLLGLPAIAGAWGKSKMSIGSSETIVQETSTNEDPTPEPAQSNIPDCDNCYYKNKGKRKAGN